LLERIQAGDPVARAQYVRALQRRRARNSNTAESLTPEQQEQYRALQQQVQQSHDQRMAAVDRTNAAWAATHGYDYKTPGQLSPSFWRELKEGASWQIVGGVKMLGRMIVGALRQNAQHTGEIMEQAHERGIPMTPMGASFAAGVSDTVEGISVDIAQCKEDLERALEAETKAEKALHAFEAMYHLGKAGVGAYALAEPVGAMTEGGGTAGGMSLATASVDGTSGSAVAVVAKAEATTAPIGSALGGVTGGHVDDGRSYAKRNDPGSGETGESGSTEAAPRDESKRMPDPEAVEKRRQDWAHHYAGEAKAATQSGGPIQPPRDLKLPAFPKAQKVRPKTPVQGGGKLRARWQDPEGTIYEWDYQHGTVEAYNPRGKHLGEFDPKTGAQLKPADATRSVEP
jgi:hypothetical protein